jgi:hypothetical protein
MRLKGIYGNGETRGAGVRGGMVLKASAGRRYPEAEMFRSVRACPAYFPLLKKKRGTPGKQAS